MDPIDYKYSNLLSTRLDNFKVKNTHPYKANFRCYVCGDSEKSKTKSRGWVYEIDNKAFYKCYNCGYTKPIWFFLRQYFPAMYNDYVVDGKLERDILKNKNSDLKPLDTLVHKQPEFKKKTSPLKSIQKLSGLRSDHPARLYMNSRKIPVKEHHRIWYAPKYNKWVNSLLPDKIDKGVKDEPRLVFPFINEHGKVVGFTGRSFKKDSLRYMTIMLDSSEPKIFGKESVNFSKEYYVLEGPIDSLFIPNSVAMAGADLSLDSLESLHNAVFVFDNEPRNKEIVRRMDRILESGYKLVIWPDKLKQKDVNDMVMDGYSPMKLIRENTYMGLYGQLQMKYWSKVE